jgi:hypothetical protein
VTTPTITPATLTNYDASGCRWSADRTVRVIPQYDRDVLARQPWANPRLKPWRYEIHDILSKQTAYELTLAAARLKVAEMLAWRGHHLDWQDWEIFGDGWRRFTTDRRIEIRAGRGQDANHNGLWGVAIIGCGPDRGWLTNIRHPEARRAHLTAYAEHLAHLETLR